MDCAPAQLALAWVLAHGDDFVPISGITRSPDDLARIDEIAPKGAAGGTRYPESMMHIANR